VDHAGHLRGTGVLRRWLEEARALGPRDGIVELRDAFSRNELLTYASAISFQLLFALIPLALFGLGVLGGSGLQGVWTTDIAPQLRKAASPPVFQVLDSTVRQVLSRREVFWLTAGALLAVWEMSGALRAVMGVLNRVYGAEHERPFARRLAVSTALAAAVIAALLLAAGTLEIAPRLVRGGVLGPAVAIARWPVAIVLLWAAVALVVSVAPAKARPPRRVTLGSTLVILAWLLASTGFRFYLTDIADYGSIFGALATVIVVLTYLYVSSIALVTGVQLDALVQERLRSR
jgi:membrane protein